VLYKVIDVDADIGPFDVTVPIAECASVVKEDVPAICISLLYVLLASVKAPVSVSVELNFVIAHDVDVNVVELNGPLKVTVDAVVMVNVLLDEKPSNIAFMLFAPNVVSLTVTAPVTSDLPFRFI
jgi:hypothetical protein